VTADTTSHHAHTEAQKAAWRNTSILAITSIVVGSMLLALFIITVLELRSFSSFVAREHTASQTQSSQLVKIEDDNKASLAILQKEFGTVAKEQGLSAAVAELTCIYNRIDYDSGKAKLIPACTISSLLKKYGKT
jgi:hypothetical protein